MTDNLGPLPQEHPRSATVRRARIELHEFLDTWQEFHGLTQSEYLGLLVAKVNQRLESCVDIERRRSGK